MQSSRTWYPVLNRAAAGKVTRWLLLLNIVVFLLEGTYGDAMLVHFALWKIGRFYLPEIHSMVGFHPWQLITSAFLHASFAHLALNMLALWMFGREVERAVGAPAYLGLYVASVLSAALVQLIVISTASGSMQYPTLGASGGVFGVLLAFGLLFPRRWVFLLLPPVPMRAWLFVLLYALLELASGLMGATPGVAHFAHLGGMLGSYLVLQHLRRGTTLRAE